MRVSRPLGGGAAEEHADLWLESAECPEPRQIHRKEPTAISSAGGSRPKDRRTLQGQGIDREADSLPDRPRRRYPFRPARDARPQSGARACCLSSRCPGFIQSWTPKLRLVTASIPSAPPNKYSKAARRFCNFGTRDSS